MTDGDPIFPIPIRREIRAKVPLKKVIFYNVFVDDSMPNCTICDSESVMSLEGATTVLACLDCGHVWDEENE